MEPLPEHILVVEDESHTLFTLALVLRKDGFRVSTAKDGASALSMLQNAAGATDPFDLLVTDLQMAGFDGVDILRELDQQNSTLPVIVITSFGNEDKLGELKYKNRLICIDKPFEPVEILSRVRSMLENTS